MRTRNPSYNRARDVAEGRLGIQKAGSSGVRVRDAAGNDIPMATTLRVPWVVDLSEYEAQIGSDTGSTYVNNTGLALNIGDVVVIDGTNVITTTTPQDTRPVGIVVAGGNAGETVAVQTAGFVSYVHVTAAVTARNFAETSSTAGQATESSTRRAGSFGVYLTDGAAPSALLFGIPDSSGTGASAGSLLVLSGTLSAPPTEAEIEALVGLPADVPGTTYLVSDVSSGRHYLATSDGVAFEIVPVLGPAEPVAVTVTAAAAGGWTQITNDRAASGGNGKTYVGYVRGDNGDVCVRSISESTGAPDTERVLHAALQVDIHCAPSVLIADDRHLYVAYSAHLGTAAYIWKSTGTVDADPTLASGGTETNIDASLGGTHYTYLQLMQLAGEASSPIYLFYRDHQSSDTIIAWCYSKTTNHGTTWAAQTAFIRGNSSRAIYPTFGSDGDSRVDIAVSDGHPIGDAPTNVYHLYFTGGSFYTTAGTLISTAQPFTATAGTLVYDASANSNQSGWPVNITNADGHPTFVYQILLTSGTDCSNIYARWSGSAWVSTAVVNSGAADLDGVVGAQASVDRQSPDIVYAPVKVSGKYEIKEYRTADSGASFTLLRAITSGSSDDNIHVVSVRDADPHLRILWLHGSYTTYLVYSMGIGGLAGASTTQTLETLQRLVTVRDTKANVEAFTAATEEVVLGYATDTSELGVYTNGAWVWIGATALTVKDEGTALSTAATTLDFVGAGVTASGTGTTKTITIPGASGAAISEHVHVAYETHTSDGSTTTFILDNIYEPGSVMAWNRTTGTMFGVTEVLPDQATISAAGAAADLIDFHYAASVL